MRRLSLLFASLFAAILAGLAAGGLFYRPETSIPPGFAGKYLEVEGCKIRYIQRGAGPDVLLIHASPGSVEDWSPLIGELSKTCRVTAFDRPGHGYSGVKEGASLLEMNAQITYGLITALGLKDVVVVGHSYGGSSALALAVHNPVLIRAFVIIASAAYRPQEVGALHAILSIPFLGTGTAMALGPSLGPLMIREGILKAFSPNISAIPDGFIKERTRIWRQAKVLTTFARERRSLRANLERISPLYPRISKPLHILCGDEDPLLGDDPARLHKDVPASRLTLLEQTGHYVQYARRARVLQAVKEAVFAANEK